MDPVDDKSVADPREGARLELDVIELLAPDDTDRDEGCDNELSSRALQQFAFYHNDKLIK